MIIIQYVVQCPIYNEERKKLNIDNNLRDILTSIQFQQMFITFYKEIKILYETE